MLRASTIHRPWGGKLSIYGRTLGIAAATIWAVALSGCAAPGTGGAPMFSAGPPTPSATALVPGPPEPVLDLSCADLVPSADLTAMFGKAYPVRTDTAWLVSPREFAVQGAGGIACLWGNDVPEHKGEGFSNAASDLLQVTVLPGVTTAQWAKYGDVYPQDEAGAAFGDMSGTGCFAGSGPSSTCTMNVLVGDVWLEVLAYGINAPAGATDANLLTQVSPVVDGVVERIRAAQVIGRQAPPVPPADPDLCDALLRGDWVQPGGGWSLVSSAAERAGVLTCLPADPNAKGVAAATLDLLPGGAWAFADAVAGTGVAVDAERVTVAGTSAPGSYLRCPVTVSGAGSETFDACSVDLAVGTDWLRLRLPIDDLNPWYAGISDDLLELAGRVVQDAGK